MSVMGGNAGEDIGEPGLRVDAVHFRRDDEAVHGCGAPSSAIRSAEQPGLPFKSDASQAPFSGIVGETHASIFQEQREARPSLQDIVERLGQVVPTGELGELFPHVDLKIIDQGTAQRLPHLNTLLRTPAIDGAFDLVQRIDPAHDLDRDGRGGISFLPAALRRAFSSMSAMAKNGRLPCDREPPGSVRAGAPPDRVGCTRHRRRPAGCRHIGPDAPEDARPCRRASSRTSLLAGLPPNGLSSRT